MVVVINSNINYALKIICKIASLNISTLYFLFKTQKAYKYPSISNNYMQYLMRNYMHVELRKYLHISLS